MYTSFWLSGPAASTSCSPDVPQSRKLHVVVARVGRHRRGGGGRGRACRKDPRRGGGGVKVPLDEPAVYEGCQIQATVCVWLFIKELRTRYIYDIYIYMRCICSTLVYVEGGKMFAIFSRMTKSNCRTGCLGWCAIARAWAGPVAMRLPYMTKRKLENIFCILFCFSNEALCMWSSLLFS